MRIRSRAPGAATALRGAAVLAAALWAGPAVGENSVFLAAAGDTVPIGSLTAWQGHSVALDLRMDFLDTTVGGGVTVLLDPARLQLDAVVFDSALGDEPALRCGPTAPLVTCPGSPDAVGFGALAGLSGSRRVATLQLTALTDGTSGSGVGGALPFSDATGDPLEVVYLPEPHGLVLLGAALAQLALLHRWRARRRRLG